MTSFVSCVVVYFDDVYMVKELVFVYDLTHVVDKVLNL